MPLSKNNPARLGSGWRRIVREHSKLSLTHIPSHLPQPSQRVTTLDKTLDDEADSFIARESAQEEIQEEIQERLAGASKLTNAQDIYSKHPSTFAEAIMSNRRGRQSSTKGSNSTTLAGAAASPETLGSSGAKCRLRKTRASKWTPLNLSANDSMSDVGSCVFSEEAEKNVDEEVSRAASPLNFTKFPQNLNSNISILPRPSCRNTTQAADDTFANLTPDNRCSLAEVLGAKEETFKEKDLAKVADNFASAMARLASSASKADVRESPFYSTTTNTRNPTHDGFDSLDWDPDLPSMDAPDGSPEPVTVNPQAVYTTVGSIVNPNIQPQIPAPNRVQREGVLRRPLVGGLANRQYERIANRGTPPPLNMQSSMQYAQQLNGSPARLSSSPPPLSARSPHSARSTQQFPNDNPSDMLSRFSSMICMPPAHPPSLPDASDVGTDQNSLLIDAHSQTRGTSQTHRQDLLREFYNSQQNVQDFSSQPHTTQQATRSNVSTMAAPAFPKHNNSGLASVGVNKDYTASTLTLEEMLRQKRDRDSSAPSVASDMRQQCTNVGVSSAAASYANPLFGAGSLPVDSSTQGRLTAPPLRYPQPLTAGPPGQRSSLQFAKRLAASRQSLRPIDTQFANFLDPYGNPTPTSPWSSHGGEHLMPTSASIRQIEVDDHTKIFDSMPISEVSKYYPRGAPICMTGQYQQLPAYIQKQMNEASKVPPYKEGQKTIGRKALDDWFYSGQRSFGMSVNEYIAELHIMEDERDCVVGRLAASKYSRPTIHKQPLSKEDIDQMTTAKASVPVVNAAFGTLLSCADEHPKNQRALNKYTKSPAWQIDRSEVGRQSVFG